MAYNGCQNCFVHTASCLQRNQYIQLQLVTCCFGFTFSSCRKSTHLLTGLKKKNVLVICEKMFLKFSQNFLCKVHFKKNIRIDNHFKLFTNQSEVIALPAGCLFLESYPVSVAQNRSIFHANHNSFISCSILPFTFDFIPQQYSILIVMIQVTERFLCSFGVSFILCFLLRLRLSLR